MEGLIECFGVFAERLIELNIPHQLVIAEDGNIIYLMLRDFDVGANCGWMQMAGVYFITGDEKITRED